MSIVVEKHLPDFDHKLIYDKHKYPQCSCGNCPNFFWNSLFIGARGQGKTYAVCQLVKHYEKNTIYDENNNKTELRTFLISPTVEANTVFQALKSLDENDIYDHYNDSVILEIIDIIKATKKECEEYAEYQDAYKAYIKLDETHIHKLPNAMLMVLARYDFEDPKSIPHFQQMKYKRPPINILILDDLMGSDAFTQKSKSALTNAVIKNRHLQVNFAILVQSMKSVPKSIRLNCSVFFLGKFQNKKIILEDLYEEVSNVLTPESFEKLYDHAINKEYGSLIIDCTHKKKRFLCGWNTELNITESP